MLNHCLIVIALLNTFQRGEEVVARVNGDAIVRTELNGRSLDNRIDELLLQQRARALGTSVEAVLRLDVSWRTEPDALRQYLSRLRGDALIEIKNESYRSSWTKLE